MKLINRVVIQFIQPVETMHGTYSEGGVWYNRVRGHGRYGILHIGKQSEQGNSLEQGRAKCHTSFPIGAAGCSHFFQAWRATQASLVEVCAGGHFQTFISKVRCSFGPSSHYVLVWAESWDVNFCALLTDSTPRS